MQNIAPIGLRQFSVDADEQLRPDSGGALLIGPGIELVKEYAQKQIQRLTFVSEQAELAWTDPMIRESAVYLWIGLVAVVIFILVVVDFIRKMTNRPTLGMLVHEQIQAAMQKKLG